MQIYLQTHVHTHIHVQDGSVYIYVSRSIYLDQSLGFHANSFVSLSLIDKSDFDEKNTNDKRVFHRNLSLFDVCYTHLYTTVTIFKKKTATISLFSIIPTVLYISNSATLSVVQASEGDKSHAIEN